MIVSFIQVVIQICHGYVYSMFDIVYVYFS